MLTQNQTPTRLSRLYSSLSARVAEDDSDVIDVVARNLNRSMSASFDGEFESLSAPRKRAAAETSPVRAKNLKKESEDQQGSTLERLLVVQYPTNPEEEVEWEKYNKIFFATNNSAAKAKGITRNDYLSVAEYLAQQAFYVNAALSLFRYIALNAGRIAASESPAVQVGVNWGLYTTGFNPKIATEAAVGMLNACAQGNSHIIRKVPGAYVLMFTGIPGFGLAHGKSTEINAPVLDSGDAYTKALLSPEGALSTKIGSAAVKAAQYILDSVSEVSDSTSFSNSTRRIVSMVPLKEAQAGGIISYAFSMFRKITGIEMPKIEIPNPSSALVNGVGTYLSALVIKEANDSLVRRKINAKGTIADSELGHAPQLEAINGSVSYSIAMTIPESIARYISQSLPGERVSLVALNTWASVWASGMLTHGRKQKGTRINGKFIRNLPRYVLPASKTKELTQRRKEVGYYTEPGKGNDENIFIANNGTLQYLPKADDLMLDNAAAYEKVLEEALATSFNAGAPLNTSAQRPADPVFDLQHPGYADAVSSLKRRLDAYQGSVQSFSWDYNVILTTSVAQSDRIVATSLNGSTKPNAMFIADYMRKPFADSMALMFPHAIGEDGDRVDASSFGKDLRTCSGMLNTTPFKGVFDLYDYLVNEEAIAPFEALLKDAAAELKIKDLTDGPHAEYERGLYTAVVSNTLTVTGGTRDEFGLERKPSWFVRAMLEAAIKDAEAHPRSNLAKAVFDRNQRDGSSDTPEDDPHYFHAGSMTLREFSNVFSYLGGRVFQLLLKALTKVDRKHFMVVNDNSDLKLPPFTSIVSEIMPLATMFATYVPNYEKVYEAAGLVIESNTPNDSFTADDIHLPGSGPKFQLFPHQVQGFSQLSRFPAFAILDVSPGGGKCLVGNTMVPTTKGLFSLEELRAMSGKPTGEEGFLSLKVGVFTSKGVKNTSESFSRFGKTHKVVLSDGTEFEGLPEHSLHNGFDFVRLDGLKKGDWIPRRVGTNLYSENVPEFNLEQFSDLALYEGLKLPKKLTTDLASLFGYLVAEGTLMEHLDGVNFTAHDPEVRDDFAAKAVRLFGEECVQVAKVTVRFRCPAVKAFVRHYCGVGTAQYKSVPFCVRQAPKKYQLAFLNALFEGDGYVDFWDGGWHLGYSSISQTLASQVKVMLENMGICPRLKKGRPYESSNGNAHIGYKVTTRHSWSLAFHYTEWPAFQKLIPFISTRKTSNLQLAVERVRSLEHKEQHTNSFSHGHLNKLPVFDEIRGILARVDEICEGFTISVQFGNQTRSFVPNVATLSRYGGFGRLKGNGGHETRYSVDRLLDFLDTITVPEIHKAVNSDATIRSLRKEMLYKASFVWSRVESSRKTNKTRQVFDLHVPGPHDYVANGYLSHNTTTVLTDIGMMIHNNKAKRFLVLCPTRLAKNWIEDMRKHTKDNWNFIPINTAVYKKWGEEKLSALIENAPRNTIVVVGNDWLSKTGSKQLVIGRHVERISTTAEMIKRFGFDYVAIDESHRMKRMHPTPSNVHRIVKSITTSSSVKYLRLATGTLINNVLMDVVGQAALYSSAIFRTPDEFEAANKELGVGLGGRRSLVYMNTAAKKAREHLSKYATVITTRRREWAFMLPIPKDTFVFVSLSESDEAGNAVNPADDAHRMMYEALFNSTLEDIKGNPELMSMLMGKKDIDGDDEEDEEEADDETKNKVISAALAQAADNQDEDTLEELSEALTPYLQRLEQSIVDPLGDRDAFGNEFGSVFFKGINHENYVSAKVRKIIERIDKHYQQFPWSPGKQWSKDDLCDHQGKRYMFVGKPGARSITAPSEDTENWKPQAYGKVLVFCRYIRSVEAIYKALPSKYKSLARRFHGSAANAWEGLEEFKTGAVATPEEVNSGSAKGVQIFIANEQAITEGHNLQMASRMVRVEMPWAPGDLDQSSARIFRPDPSGKFARDFINLDWVIGNGTLEVAKLGCLVSKILTKAQFDEADNDFKATDADGNEFGYGDLNKANLPTIKMSLKNIENIRWAEDLQEFSPDGTKLDYLDEYRKFVQLQGADFLHMRKTRTAHMIDIEPTPMPKDAKKLEFQPYVSAQKVVGHDDWGLVLLSEYLQNDSDPEAQPYIADKKLLKGKFVHTEFGNGVIIGTRTTNASGKKAASSEDEGDPQTRLSSVRVQLAGTNEVITLDADVVHLARTLDAKQVKLFAPKDLWNKSEADRKRQEEAEEADRKKSARDARKVREEIDRERKEIKISRRIKDKAPIVKRGRQVEEAFEDDDTDQDVQPSVELNPVVYNGYIALEGVSDTEDEASVLKKFGFKPFGDYVYIKIPNWQTFDAVLSFLDKKFFLSDQIYNRLVKTEDSFTSGRGRKFDVDLAPVAEFKNFYILSHRKSLPKGANGKPELKVYPMIIGQNLFFVADMETNPVTRKLVGTSIPGATSKWGIADGMFISFFSTKAQLKAKALEIKKAGITIDNWSEFVTAYNELKVGKVQKSEKERVVREPVRKTAANKAVKAPVKAVPPKKAPLKQVATKAVKVPVKSAPKKAPVKKAAAAVKTSVKKATPTAASKKPVRR